MLNRDTYLRNARWKPISVDGWLRWEDPEKQGMLYDPLAAFDVQCLRDAKLMHQRRVTPFGADGANVSGVPDQSCVVALGAGGASASGVDGPTYAVGGVGRGEAGRCGLCGNARIVGGKPCPGCMSVMPFHTEGG